MKEKHGEKIRGGCKNGEKNGDEKFSIKNELRI
jgi:hypothetical protein